MEEVPTDVDFVYGVEKQGGWQTGDAAYRWSRAHRTPTGTEQVLSSLVGSWAFCLTMRASTLRTGEFSSPLKLVRYLVSAVDGNSIMLVICNKF